MPKMLELIKKPDPDHAEASARLKSDICQAVSLYAQKYEEEFAPYLPSFVEAIWVLLLETGAVFRSYYSALVLGGT